MRTIEDDLLDGIDREPKRPLVRCSSQSDNMRAVIDGGPKEGHKAELSRRNHRSAVAAKIEPKGV